VASRRVTKCEPVEDAALADDPTRRLRGVLLRLQPHTPTDPKARAVFEEATASSRRASEISGHLGVAA
jgi:hypothetical protein